MNLNTGNKQEKKPHESKSLVFEISIKLTFLARVTFLNKGEKNTYYNSQK